MIGIILLHLRNNRTIVSCIDQYGRLWCDGKEQISVQNGAQPTTKVLSQHPFCLHIYGGCHAWCQRCGLKAQLSKLWTVVICIYIYIYSGMLNYSIRVVLMNANGSCPENYSVFSWLHSIPLSVPLKNKRSLDYEWGERYPTAHPFLMGIYHLKLKSLRQLRET